MVDEKGIVMEAVKSYGEFSTCLKCNGTRGRAEKALMEFCDGYQSRPRRSESGEMVHDPCEYGAAEHLHVKCAWCGHVSAMETADHAGLVVAPLTNSEILKVRELLALTQESEPLLP